MKSSGQRAREGQLQEGAAAGHVGPQRRGAGDAAAAPGARDQGFPGGAKGKGPAAREPERERTPRAPLRPRGPAAAGGRGLGPAGGSGVETRGRSMAGAESSRGRAGQRAVVDVQTSGHGAGRAGRPHGRKRRRAGRWPYGHARKPSCDLFCCLGETESKAESQAEEQEAGCGRGGAMTQVGAGGRRWEQSCAALGSTGAWAGTVSLK